MPSLTIIPQPFRSSNLSIPPSPHSPLSPLETTFSRPTPQPYKPYPAASNPIANVEPILSEDAPPAKPLQWLWQCHVCSRNYPLAATRRCLDDGHYFCSGESQGSAVTRRGHVTSKKSRKGRHGKACASEFDYVGWQAYGDWRRHELGLRELVLGTTLDGIKSTGRFEVKQKKNCSVECNYPSECRWGKLGGVSASEVPVSTPLTTIMEDVVQTAPASFEEILGLTPPDMVMDDDLDNLVSPASPPSPKDHSPSFWSSLLTSAKSRQKSKGRDADVDMTDVVTIYNPEDHQPVADANIFVVGHEEDMEIVPLSPPAASPAKSPFELTRPLKRASAGGHPLVPSPLRLSRTASTSSLSDLAQQQTRLGLGIVMVDHGASK